MTMWGGRFEGEMSDLTRRFTADHADRRLLGVDICASIAHARMLGKVGIIESQEAETLVGGLQQMLEEGFEFLDADEDVHSAVERRLGELVGEVAGKLHTARSRNDQVAVDVAIYVRDQAHSMRSAVLVFASTLADIAEVTSDVVIPTYTHLQQAQITSLGNHLLAFAWMAMRDAGRFGDVASRASYSPLGAGASAGSSLPISRDTTAAELGFEGVVDNSLDAVGSRDMVSEFVFCCAQAMVHLSRLAEEVVLWSTAEFGWVTLGDGVSTGSSALPQKRNPDVAELVRGRTGTVVGDVVSILTLQKGLPLAYNRDLQEDKRVLFHAGDTLASSVEAMSALLDDIEFHPPPPLPETKALALAEKLVGRGVPFRQAHEMVGRLIKSLESDERTLDEVTGGELAEFDARFEPSDLPLEPVLPDLRDQIADLRSRL